MLSGNPTVFTDTFDNPDYWLENNETHNWKTATLPDGERVYGCFANDKTTATWLHVFETNVDITLRMKATPAEMAKVTILARLCGRNASVKAGYDFHSGKWYLTERLGADFEEKRYEAADSAAWNVDAWHVARLRLIDDHADIMFDGTLVLSVRGIRHVTTGRVGVMTENTALLMNRFSVALLSGQGRVEKAPVANYIIPFADFAEGGSIFPVTDDLYIANYKSILYLSFDKGQTFRKAMSEEEKQYSFFAQSDRTQYIRLHTGNILKIDNYTGGKAYLSIDNGATSKQVGKLWDADKLEKNWSYYGGMNDMLKEVRLADGRYRVFYCADIRAYGNPEGNGRIDHHWEEVYYTDDEGATWHKSIGDTRLLSALNHICESRIVACDDGTLRMYCSWNESNCFRYFISYDNGVSWGTERALPQLRIPRGSHCLTADPTNPGTVYAVCVYEESFQWANPQPRTRLGLIRTRNGRDWEYLLDCWRWDECAAMKRPEKPPICQIVDPSITVTAEHVLVTSGWSEEIGTHGYHNHQQQVVLKLNKRDLVAYDSWPTFTPAPNEIVNIEAVPPKKTEYSSGEDIDLTGGAIIVYYYDGTTACIPMNDESVSICEPNLTLNYTTVFAFPDLRIPGVKHIRADYEHFAASFDIVVH